MRIEAPIRKEDFGGMFGRTYGSTDIQSGGTKTSEKNLALKC